MASFKGIRERINSVKATRKITSAMKMVSSAKLHRAQRTIGNMLPYSRAVEGMLKDIIAAGDGIESPLAAKRPVNRVAVVAFSSDASLAGSFNSNVARLTREVVAGHMSKLGKDNVDVYTVGKKIFEAVTKSGIAVTRNYDNLATKPDYDTIAGLAASLISQFAEKKVDRVELVYHHFKSAGSQLLTHEEFLPISLGGPEAEERHTGPDYIFEPSREKMLDELLPRSLRLKLYTVLLDSAASEHAARVIAMQSATENADELISELTIEYNKSRQQAITNELLDMVGGQAK